MKCHDLLFSNYHSGCRINTGPQRCRSGRGKELVQSSNRKEGRAGSAQHMANSPGSQIQTPTCFCKFYWHTATPLFTYFLWLLLQQI